MDGLLDDGVDCRLTMTLSPTPARRCSPTRCSCRATTATSTSWSRSRSGRSTARAGWRRVPGAGALLPRRALATCGAIFRDAYGTNLVRAFRKHRDAGKLEIITCGATHGFLPADGHGARGRARAGPDRRCRTTGASSAATRRASGCPSAATCPGDERFLRDAGIRYFFVDTHGVTDAAPAAAHGVYAPILSPGGVAVLRPRPRVVAAGLERRGRATRATPTTASSTATSAATCARLPRRPASTTGSARTSASSTTASPARWTSPTSSRTSASGRWRRPPTTPATS